MNQFDAGKEFHPRRRRLSAAAFAVLVVAVLPRAAMSEPLTEQQKRDFMKSCIGEKKSAKDYAERQQQSDTTAEGTCEKDLQNKLK